MDTSAAHDFIVNAIPARVGGTLTYARELARTLPTVAAPDRTTLVAPSLAIPDDAPAALRHVPVDGTSLCERVDAETRLLYSLVTRCRNPVLYMAANFSLVTSSIPQLLLVHNSIYLDPVSDEHVFPRLSAPTRIGLLVRRGLTLASARQVHTVITPSTTMRDLLLAHSPDLRDKIVVNKYGMRLEQFTRAAAARSPSPRGTLRVICHSLIGAHKPVWPIIAAVHCVRRLGVRATLLLMDDPSHPSHCPHGDGVHQDDVRWARRGLREGWLTCLHRVGHDAVPDLLAAQDTFVFHTLTESYGFPYLEAMAAGLSSIVTDIPIAREMCSDTARFVPLFSPEAIADRLEEDASDPDARLARGERARAYVASQSDTWEQHCARCAKLMRKMA